MWPFYTAAGNSRHAFLHFCVSEGQEIGLAGQPPRIRLHARCGTATRCRTRTTSLCVPINGHEKRWDFKFQRIVCKPVLRRTVEITQFRRRYAEISKRGARSFAVDAFSRTMTRGARLVRERVAQPIALGAFAVAGFFAEFAFAAREQAEKTADHRLARGFVRHRGSP